MINLFKSSNQIIPIACHQTAIRSIATSSIQFKKTEMKQWIRTVPYRDEGIQGIDLIGVVDKYEKKFLSMVDFPGIGVEKIEYEDGLKFEDLPIIEMITHKNNTRLACHDYLYSKMIDYTSGGTEGFKNCKKDTTVASHAAGYAMGKKLLIKGHRQVRLAIRGIGTGRKAAIQGMNAAGLKIVSITDITNYNPYPKMRAPRPLKR